MYSNVACVFSTYIFTPFKGMPDKHFPLVFHFGPGLQFGQFISLVNSQQFKLLTHVSGFPMEKWGPMNVWCPGKQTEK